VKRELALALVALGCQPEAKPRCKDIARIELRVEKPVLTVGESTQANVFAFDSAGRPLAGGKPVTGCSE
jgi:hypothetical protein